MEQKISQHMTQWYALHTKPNKERSVASLLEDHDIDTFLPMIVSHGAPKQKRQVPFFRSYIFASLDLKAGKSGQWRWTPGLRYVVSYGDDPIPIPDEVIHLVDREAQVLSAWAKTQKHPFKPGDMVRIKNGPFRDMLAIFQGPTRPSERVQILLTALSQSVRIRTDASNLEKYAKKSGPDNNKRKRRSRGRGRPIR